MLTPEQMAADLKKASDTITALEGKLADAERLAKMTDAEKEHCKDLTPEQKEKFMALPEGLRQAQLSKAAKEDETLTVDGVTLRKSQTDPTVFALLRKQAERAEAQAVEIAKANERAELAILEKRAVDEFPSLPGTPADKAQILKYVAGAPAPVKAGIEALLKAHEAMAAGAFRKIGSVPRQSGDGGATGSPAGFTTKVAEIQKRDGCTHIVAMQKAQREAPEDFAAYQAEGAIPVGNAA